MTEYFFETHEPVDLTVETGKGTVHVTCTDTTETTVVVEGKDADEVEVDPGRPTHRRHRPPPPRRLLRQ